MEKLLNEENKELIKITNYITKDYSKIYLELIILIKAIIDTLLLSYFDKIFKNIKEIKINENVDNQSIIVDSYKENVCGRVITFKNSISNYGYSYIINLFYKDFKMNINIQVSGYSDIDSYYAIPNYRYYVYGRIGDGTIGIKAIEDLTNGKTDVEAYINNNAVTYYHKRNNYHDSCTCRRRRLRGLLRALCGHWHYNAHPLNVPQKLKSIFKSY